jgi:hypothetical protein
MSAVKVMRQSSPALWLEARRLPIPAAFANLPVCFIMPIPAGILIPQLYYEVCIDNDIWMISIYVIG